MKIPRKKFKIKKFIIPPLRHVSPVPVTFILFKLLILYLNSIIPCFFPVGSDTELVLSPINSKTTLGEVNILRFFDSLFSPEVEASVKIAKDELLDLAHRLNHASGKEVHVIVSKLSNLLGKDGSFVENYKLTNADVGIWSALCKKVKLKAMPSNIKNWVVSFNSQLGAS